MINSLRLILILILFCIACAAFAQTVPPFSDNESPVFENTYLIDNISNNSVGADFTLRINKKAPFDCKNKIDCPASVIVSNANGSVNMPTAVNVGSLHAGKNPVIDGSGRWVGSPTGLVGPQGPKGETGPQGLQGIQGIKGETGATGPQGLKGDAGSTGAQGPQGIQGPKGDTGATGPQGLKGDTGAAGVQGPQGIKGDTGARGPEGPQGVQGIKGDTGSTGSQGPKGDQGTAGAQGIKGDTGAAGPQGIQGTKGATGATGLQGLKGDTGTQGPQGIQGPKGENGLQGIQGPKGDTGLQGIQGLKGDKGDSCAIVGPDLQCGATKLPLSSLKGSDANRCIVADPGFGVIGFYCGIKPDGELADDFTYAEIVLENLRGPSGTFKGCRTVEKKDSVSNPIGQRYYTSAGCADDEVVTGGGCGSTALNNIGGNPGDRSASLRAYYICSYLGTGTFQVTTAYATCCKI